MVSSQFGQEENGVRTHSADSRLHTVIAAVVCLAVTAFLVVPSLVTIPLSFSDQSFVSLSFDSSNITMKWYSRIAEDNWRRGIGNSMLVALATSLLSSLLGIMSAYVVVRNRGRWKSSVVWCVAFAIVLTPPIWLATGYLRMFGEVSALALLIPHSVLAFPFALVFSWMGLSRIDPDVPLAAEILGASHNRVLWGILVPSAAPYILVGALFAFMTSWDESVFSLLYTLPHEHLLPKLAFETIRRERELTIAAVNVLSASVLIFATRAVFVMAYNE